MDEEARNRKILTIIVVLMLIILIILFVLISLKKTNNENKKIILEQLYVSENSLKLYDKYYYGIKDNTIYSIIDREGKELYLSDVGINYNSLDKLKDETYLISLYKDNIFTSYLFDGKNIKEYLNLDNITDIKKIINIEDNTLIALYIKKDDKTYLYSSNLKYIEIPDIEIISLQDKEDIYINTYNNLIVKKDNKEGIIDLEGNILVDYIYDDIKYTSNGYIVKNKNKYGILDNNYKTIFKTNNKYIYGNKYGYLVYNKKLDIYDKDLKKIISNYKYNIDEDILIDFNKVDYNYYIVANNDLLIINNNKINKSTIDKYYYNDYLYTYKDNNLDIYDNFLNKIKSISIKLNNIEKIIKLDDDKYYIEYDNNKKIINNNNISNSRKLLNKLEDYSIYQEEKNIYFISKNDETLERIYGNDIIIDKNNIIIDDVVYKIVYK